MRSDGGGDGDGSMPLPLPLLLLRGGADDMMCQLSYEQSYH